MWIVVAAVILGLGFICMALDQIHRTLHDILTVLKERKDK